MNARLLIFSWMLCPLLSFAQGKQLSLYDKLFYKETLRIENPMSGMSNPIRTSHIPFEASTNIGLGYKNESGDLHSLQTAEQLHNFNLNISGNKKIGKMAFEGMFDYLHNKELQRRWNSTLLIAPDNPFVLADSIRSNFTVETFSLAGSVAYTFNPRWQAGVNLSYVVGSSADQTDPRSETNGMRLKLTPGIMFNAQQWSFGLSAHANWLSESITYTSVLSTQNHTLFLLNGMGMYEGRTTLSYHRRYAGLEYGGEMQFLFRPTAQRIHLLEMGMTMASEDAIDGATSEKFRGGLYKRTQFNIKEESRWRSGAFRHTLRPSLQLSTISGTWFTQKQTTDNDGNVIWQVKDQSVCHTEQRIEASLQHRMDKTFKYMPTLSTFAEIGFTQSAMKHYPEEFTQTYRLAYINAAFTKHKRFYAARISATIGGHYTHSLGSDIDANGITLQRQYTIPLLAYNAASTYGLKGRLDLSFALSKPAEGSALNLFADYTYRRYIGSETYFADRTQHLVQAGISWTF